MKTDIGGSESTNTDLVKVLNTNLSSSSSIEISNESTNLLDEDLKIEVCD